MLRLSLVRRLTGTLGRCALVVAFGCAGQQVQPGTSDSANYAQAAVAVAAGAALWAVGGGCRLQGCPYGSFCNEKSGFCDVVKCSAGCPQGTICNEGLDRCQVPPPPSTPNDSLPQDDARNLPTQH